MIHSYSKMNVTAFTFVFCFALSLKAQTENSKVLSRAKRDSIENILVKLAMQNNLTGKASVYRYYVAERMFRQEQRSWLDLVKLQGNLNEFTLEPTQNIRSQYFPRYNFSLSLSLGEFINRPAMIRTRRIESEVAKIESDGQLQTIKSDVLKGFNHYLFTKERLTIQRKLESEIGINLDLSRAKFNQGNETYDAYSALLEKYYNLQLSVKELEESLEEAKLTLEALIGVKLETVTGNLI